MNWNSYSALEGRHAFLGASKWHWINYDEEKLKEAYRRSEAAERGTELHKFAADAIRLGMKLQKSRRTINAYVNDAIGFKMKPEQILFYSLNAFGTVDAISFEKNFLRIHDLKTGVTPVSFNQLIVYAAYFCLEYRHDPFEIEMELRIYQMDEIEVYIPDPAEVKLVMEKTIEFDRLIELEKEKMGV